MCLQPKKILNRSLHFDETKPLYLTVPCGHCVECLRAKRDEWFTRCYYEWQVPGTMTFFYTLTYNNENLPKFGNLPCFSKRDIQLFLKRLRYYLGRHGLKCKYMVCSEYGEQFHRPHYHILTFINQVTSPYWFYRCIQDAWQKGFVKAGDNFGVVNSFAGIKYVTKYVTKDFSALDSYIPAVQSYLDKRYNALLDYIKYRFDKYHDVLIMRPINEGYKFRVYTSDKHLELDEDKRQFISKLQCKINQKLTCRAPFHLQSTYLGAEMAKKRMTIYELLNEKCLLMEGGNLKPHAMPAYFKRLFWYDLRENERDGKKTDYVLNDKGIAHKLDISSKVIDNKVRDYASLLRDSQSVSEEVTKLVCDSTSVLFRSKYDLIHYMEHFDLDLEVMAIYSVYFRHRLMMSVPVLNEDTVKDSYLDYAEYCFNETMPYDFGKIFEKFCGRSKVSIFDLYMWDTHPFFQPYEKSLQVLECLSLSSRINKGKAYQERDENARKLRELLNKIV